MRRLLPRPSSSSAIASRLRALLRLLQVRLRIPVILLVAAIVAGQWDVLRTRWDKLTRPLSSQNAAMLSITSDVEYFCPMDPGVLSAWPGKCGVCHMTLVVRKKGDATILPDGVIARMQISPYRVQLSGILTAPVDFRPLVRTREASGVVKRRDGQAIVSCEVPARRAPWIAVGQDARIVCRDLPELPPRDSRVALVTPRVVDDFETLQIEVAVDDDAETLRPGMIADVTFRVPAADLEPFRSQPSDPPARRPDEPVQVYACVDHPDSIGLSPGRCPEDQLPRGFRELEASQRVRWWCPMHPEVTADRPGAHCERSGGMELRPRIVTFRPAGQVLAVPETAVVDTGTRTVVFVESMTGLFDGVEVHFGAVCGDAYPVIDGLEAGQQVVIRGAFLLDAETRLDPSLAAAYFGAARRQTEASAPSTVVPASSSEEPPAVLSAADLALIQTQAICPVTRKPLGSMGTPVRVEVGGRVVFLCCSGCEGKLRGNPSRYLGARSESGASKP